MEIHSSSLAFIPAGFNGKNRNDPSQFSNADKVSRKENSEVLSSTTETVDVKTNIAKLQKISDDIEDQQKTPSNSRTARAVNAYILESSESLKTQRSALIPGLDLFV